VRITTDVIAESTVTKRFQLRDQQHHQGRAHFLRDREPASDPTGVTGCSSCTLPTPRPA
jgi:hypothetical protein